ncbi:GWxTD domain-containing protein [candidate division KSB1 bacterium]
MKRCTKLLNLKSYLYLVFFAILLHQSEFLSAASIKYFKIVLPLREIPGDPLMGVNVYLANTTYGFGSNRDGSFYIFRIPPGDYTLIASHIGYEPFTRDIRLTESEHEVIEIELKPVVFGTGEVVVTARNLTEWQNNLEIFKNTFLGWSKSAAECEILNKEVLDFSIDEQSGAFSATAGDLLHIENRALGYRLDMLLVDFVVEGRKITYRGEPRYTELTTFDPEERDKYRENRLKTYLGSQRHFLNALYHGRIREEGFRAYNLSNIDESTAGTYYREIIPDSLLKPTRQPNLRELSFNGFLKVIYTNEKESTEYVSFSRTHEIDITRIVPDQLTAGFGGDQISWMGLNYPSVNIDNTGNLQEQFAVTNYGYWAWERFADKVPIDYAPPDQPAAAEPAAITYDSLAFLDRIQRQAMLSFDPQMTDLTDRLETDYNTKENLNQLGYLLIKYDHLDSAREVFSRSLDIDDLQADAHAGLGLVNFHYGLNENITVPNIEKEILNRNYRNAEREYLRALEIDPGFDKARSFLADLYLELGGEYQPGRARDILIELIERSERYPEAYGRLGEAYFALGDMQSAKEAFLRQLESAPAHAPSNIYLGIIYNRIDSIEKVSEPYLKGLALLRDPKMLDEITRYMFPLFTDEIKEAYALQPFERRGAFLAQFWRARDPNIITLENERLLEHLHRVDYVNEEFFSFRKRGYDDRGEVYLKYGEPDNKYVAPEGMNSHRNESWTYFSVHSDLSFDFVYRTSDYERVTDLSYALLRGRTGIGSPRSLYQDRAFLGGMYGEMAVTGNFDERLQLNASLKETAAVTAPPEKFVYAPPVKPFPLLFTVAQFKAANNRTELEIIYGIPQEAAQFEQSEDRDSVRFESQLVVFDPFGQRADFTSRKSISAEHAETVTGRRYSPGKEIVAAAPGSYTFGLEIKPEGTEQTGIAQFRTAVRDFSAPGLLISDIVLCGNEDFLRIEPGKDRHELGIIPYPVPNVRKEDPLVLYYEIYNLTVKTDGQSSYTVTYSVSRRESGQTGGIGSLFRKLGSLFTGGGASEVKITQDRTGSAPDPRETISLDINALPSGEADITVTIRDRISGMTASASRPVIIME